METLIGLSKALAIPFGLFAFAHFALPFITMWMEGLDSEVENNKNR